MSGSSAAISASVSRSSASERSAVNVCSLREARACSDDTFAAASWSSQKPGSPIAGLELGDLLGQRSGSKIVREQLELITDGREALRRGL